MKTNTHIELRKTTRGFSTENIMTLKMGSFVLTVPIGPERAPFPPLFILCV
jgi:hypothetical protein